MNIEESIEHLKLKIKNDNLTIQGMFGDIYEEIQKDNEAIETLLIAYEKEIELNKAKIISDSFHKYVGKKFDKEFISKDKLEVILEKYKHTELGDDEKILKFYKELQSLLKEE